MFELVTNPDIFKTSFGAISQVINEVQIEVDADGLRLNAISKNHITWVGFEIKKNYFDKFESTKPCKLNIDAEELMKILKRSKKDDVMQWTTDAANLVIVLENNVKKTFKIKLIDDDYKAPSKPDVEYPCQIHVPVKMLKEAVKDIDVVSGHVKFSIDDVNLKLSAYSEFGDATIEYMHDFGNLTGSGSAVFVVDHVKELLKADKFSDDVEIRMGEDLPLNLIMEDEFKECRLDFMVAPFIDDM